MDTIPPERAPKPGLNIYGSPGLNSYKLTIAVEELGIHYNYVNVDMGKGELLSEWYTSINPNSRVPALIHVKEDGTSVTVFESAACLLYVASEFDKEHKISYPAGTSEYWSQLSWLSWQVAGYGPMMGQACHFNRYTPQPEPYGSWRYTAESRRLNHVLDEQLSKSAFVAGDRLTVADIAIFIFADANSWAGVDINEFPNVKVWHDKLAQRPGFQKGLQVPTPYAFSQEKVFDLDGQDYYKNLRKFGSKYMKQATDKWQGDVVAVPSDHANY